MLNSTKNAIILIFMSKIVVVFCIELEYIYRMENLKLKKRLDNLCKDGYIHNEDNIILFNEYENDKLNNVLPKDSEARTLLILGNIKLVYYVLNSKMGIEFPAGSEEFSIGVIGLIKAVETFNLNNGVKFSTYAIQVITNEIRMYYRKFNNKSHVPECNTVSLDDYFSDEEKEFPKAVAIDMDSENFIQQLSDEEIMTKIVQNLKYLRPYERTSIIYSFGLFDNDVLNQGEIAEKINTSRSYVSKSLKEGLIKLKILITNVKELSIEERGIRYKILEEYKKKVDNTFEFK